VVEWTTSINNIKFNLVHEIEISEFNFNNHIMIQDTKMQQSDKCSLIPLLIMLHSSWRTKMVKLVYPSILIINIS